MGIPGYDPHLQAGDCWFDPAAARKAIRFMETELSHVKGELARKPLLLARWQRAIVANLFGWKRPDGTRRYRDAFIFVPRKNGKTTLAAALLLYLLFEDGEPGAEIYGAASTFGQACYIFDPASGMVRQNTTLSERASIYRGAAKAIQLHDDFSTYRVLTSESASAHGGNTHAYAVDEVHALADGELIEVLETSTGARRQPLGVLISTSDFDREGSPCNALHDRACKIRDGIIDAPSFLPVIYEADKDDDWTDPKVWAKANPNLGVSVGLEHIQGKCEKAQDSPAFENTFKRLHLNIRTEQNVRWITMALWDEGAVPVDADALKEKPCYAGLDLASTRDTTAFVLLFPDDDGGYDVLPYYWIPRTNAVERNRRDRVDYLTWARQSCITLTNGDAIDYGVVRRDINALGDLYGIKEIAVDRLFQGEQMCQQLAEQDGFEVIAFGQGHLSMAAPTKAFERLLLERKLRHGGNPVLRWQASNVTVKLDEAGNMKPDKKRSTERIDGIVAAIMALGRAMLVTDTTSVYETSDLFVIE
jgi:phage terminase large subunit-like protein